MNILKKLAPALAVIITVSLCGCNTKTESPNSSFGNANANSMSTTEISVTSTDNDSNDNSSENSDSLTSSNDPSKDLPTVREYIQQVVREHTAKIENPGMSDFEKVKAAFDYVMEIGYFVDSPALDVWRWRTAADTMPTREEMRGLNMLLWGAETCEGYACALNMLLEEMGVETRYMTGLTYLARGGLGYHSWSQVKIDGVWYHIDPELEDGISRGGSVAYKYFLKSDSFMRNSHFWGQRLLDMHRLAEEQEAEIAAYYMGEECPIDYPAPPRGQIAITEEPDVEAIRADLREELAAYEERYGKLEYMDLGTEPPVFINYFLDKRGVPGIDQDMVTFAEIYQPTHCIIRKAGTENADLSMVPESKQFGFILY